MYNNHFFKKKLNYAGAFEVVVTGSQSPGSKTRIIFDVRLGVRFSLNWDFSQLESSQKN